VSSANPLLTFKNLSVCDLLVTSNIPGVAMRQLIKAFDGPFNKTGGFSETIDTAWRSMKM
jgi:hypothetical protein